MFYKVKKKQVLMMIGRKKKNSPSYCKAHDGVWPDALGLIWWFLSRVWRKVFRRPAAFHAETKNDPVFTLQTARMHPCRRDADPSPHKVALPGQREKRVLCCLNACDGKNRLFYPVSQSCPPPPPSLSLSLSDC